MIRNITRKTSVIGLLRNTAIFPFDVRNALLRFVSRVLERTKARRSGDVGRPHLPKIYPRNPPMSMMTTPNIELLVEYAPMKQIIRIDGIMTPIGTRTIFCSHGMHPRDIASERMFEMKRDAIRPHAKSGLVEKSIGPGLRPHIIRPPRRTARPWSW